MSILSDNFNDNSRDTVMWALGAITFENAGVGVAEINGQLEITPLANEPSAAIYGYQSVSTFNFTGQEARIRLVEDYGAPSEAWLVVVLDANNYFRIHAVGGGSLFTRLRTTAGGNANVDHGAFSFGTHTHWKIRHDKLTDEIVWEYSANGSSWTELRRLTRPFAITSVTIYLSGGSAASSATPPVIKFDDLVVEAPVGPALFRGRSFAFFDDEEVNRAEFWPAVAAGAILERSASLSATTDITTAGELFSVFNRSTGVDTAATVATSGQFFSVSERSATVFAIASIEVDGHRVAERAASLSAAASIESSGTGFTVFDHSTSLSAVADIFTVGESFTLLERTANIDSTASVTTTAQFFTSFERSATVTTTASIEAAGQFLTVFERGASLDTTAGITTSGHSILDRTALIAVTITVEAGGESFSVYERVAQFQAVTEITVSGQSFSTFSRSVSLDATAQIATSGVFFTTFSAQAALDSTVTIGTSGRIALTLQRSVAIDTVIGIASAGEIDAAGEFNRSAALDTVSSISVSGYTIRERSAALNAIPDVSTDAYRISERNVAIFAAAGFSVFAQSFSVLSRAVEITMSITITSSGSISGEWLEYERWASVNSTATISVTAQRLISQSIPSRTHVLNFPQQMQRMESPNLIHRLNAPGQEVEVS